MTAMTRAAAMLRRGAVLGSAMLVLGLAGGAKAYAGRDPVDLKVVDRETGHELPVWRRDGRLFVAGEQGARYSLRVTNHTDGRVLVVMSVDGVNIYTGQTAGYDQGGYILDPHESYDVTGWRKSTTEVAAFAFSALAQSYAAETGRPGNVGVIGMAVFKERGVQSVTPLIATPAPSSAPPKTAVPRRRSSPSLDVAPPPPLPIPPVPKPLAMAPPVAPAPAIAAPDNAFASRSEPSPADEKLGTAHGARERSVIHVERFDRATSYPALVRQIEYDSYANLAALGVIPQGPHPGAAPRAFPPDQPGFVPDPPARF